MLGILREREREKEKLDKLGLTQKLVIMVTTFNLQKICLDVKFMKTLINIKDLLLATYQNKRNS